MTSKNQKKLREGGSKGGRSKSPRKRQAAKQNLRKANNGKRLAREIALIDHQIANNRLMRENATEEKIIKVLDNALEVYLFERKRLEALKFEP